MQPGTFSRGEKGRPERETMAVPGSPSPSMPRSISRALPRCTTCTGTARWQVSCSPPAYAGLPLTHVAGAGCRATPTSSNQSRGPH